MAMSKGVFGHGRNRAFSTAPKGRSGPIRHPVDPREFCAPLPMRRLGRPQRVLQLRVPASTNSSGAPAPRSSWLAFNSSLLARAPSMWASSMITRDGTLAGREANAWATLQPSSGRAGRDSPKPRTDALPSALHDPFSPRLRRQQPGECVRVAPAVPGVDSHGHPNAGLVGGEILKPERQGRLAVASGAVQDDVLGDVRPPPLIFSIKFRRRVRQDRCSAARPAKNGGGRLRPGGKAHREWASGLLGGCSCASLLRRPDHCMGTGLPCPMREESEAGCCLRIRLHAAVPASPSHTAGLMNARRDGSRNFPRCVGGASPPRRSGRGR